MNRLAWWILWLGLAVGPMVRAADPLPADGPAANFIIPSSEEITSSEVMSNYRDQVLPQLYQPETRVWILIDIAMLTALLTLGGVMVWQHVHARHLWLPAAITLIYFGFLRGGCICPVGAVANLSVGLKHPERIGMSTGVIVLLPLVASLVMGRVFCASGCPLGAIQHLLGGHQPRPRTIPPLPQALLRTLPIILLAATAWLAIRGTCFLVCLLDPYKTAFFFGYGWIQRGLHLFDGGLVEPGVLWIGDFTAWAVFAAAISLGRWIDRPFCRFVCPYSVLLGGLAMVAFKRRQIDQNQCVQCGICEKTCPVNAITRDPQTRQLRISNYHCIQCNRCSSRCRKNGIA